MGSRHRSRELAVQLCYQWTLNPVSLEDPKVIDRFWRESALAEFENRVFFEMIVRGVAEWLPKIDAEIESGLENWKMSRLEKVDLAVLRVAVWELMFCTDDQRPDDRVILNEAIEIAKKFGGPESPPFVNGVLDALLRKRQASSGQPS